MSLSLSHFPYGYMKMDTFIACPHGILLCLRQQDVSDEDVTMHWEVSF